MNSTEESKTPHISVNAQYTKDLSFENPGAPASLVNTGSPPHIDLALDLNIQRMPEDEYFEVEIIISAKATSADKTLFIVDLKYAGIFHLVNVPEEQIQMLLAVHCPAIIFPFARKILADVTQDGGFQPLMIDPIDFGDLYSKKLNEKNIS
ncbi:MAG TPA: protein-export chaperone SecB [Candidatus Megaira endosymbiont of Stentor roeselii]|nr:protein-export chaperone SecB [Candidatus Megaera endosymbiont of Stentor roeselii]